MLIGNPHINRYLQCSCNHPPVASHGERTSRDSRSTLYYNELSSQRLQEGFWFTALHTLISPTSTNNEKDPPTGSINLDDLHTKASADQDQGNRSFPEVLYQVYQGRSHQMWSGRVTIVCALVCNSCNVWNLDALDHFWDHFWTKTAVRWQTSACMNILATSTNFGLPIDRLKNRKYFGGWSSLGKLRRDSTTLFAAISQVSARGTYNMHAVCVWVVDGCPAEAWC